MNDSTKDMSFWQKAELETLWLLCRGFAKLPHFVRHYIFGVPAYLIIRYVIRYRRKVIMTNLRNSFPDKSERELRHICGLNYRNLTEQIINIISQSGLSDGASAAAYASTTPTRCCARWVTATPSS